MGIKEELSAAVEARVREVMKNREALLDAWVAQTGVAPTEAVLCESVTDEELPNRCVGTVTRTWVEARKPDRREYKRGVEMSARAIEALREGFIGEEIREAFAAAAAEVRKLLEGS